MGGRGIGGTGEGGAVVVTTLLLSSSADVAVVTTAIAASVDVQSCSSNLEQVVKGGGLVSGDGADVDTAGLSKQSTRCTVPTRWRSLSVVDYCKQHLLRLPPSEVALS